MSSTSRRAKGEALTIRKLVEAGRQLPTHLGDRQRAVRAPRGPNPRPCRVEAGLHHRVDGLLLPAARGAPLLEDFFREDAVDPGADSRPPVERLRSLDEDEHA